jgi:hypothetical protein
MRDQGQISSLRTQAIYVLQRARKLPPGADRNDLRQLALGLRELERDRALQFDPGVPPLPPPVTMQQARNFSPALKGDPSEGRAFSDAVRQALASVLPSEK